MDTHEVDTMKDKWMRKLQWAGGTKENGRKDDLFSLGGVGV